MERDIIDALQDVVSPDWRFGIAYNAALKLCTILLYSSGYRVSRAAHHYYTIKALPIILGKNRKDDAEYLDACRSKRNIVEYDYTGSVTKEDVEELVSFVQELKKDIMGWLKEHHPELLRKEK